MNKEKRDICVVMVLVVLAGIVGTNLHAIGRPPLPMDILALYTREKSGYTAESQKVNLVIPYISDETLQGTILHSQLGYNMWDGAGYMLGSGDPSSIEVNRDEWGNPTPDNWVAMGLKIKDPNHLFPKIPENSWFAMRFARYPNWVYLAQLKNRRGAGDKLIAYFLVYFQPANKGDENLLDLMPNQTVTVPMFSHRPGFVGYPELELPTEPFATVRNAASFLKANNFSGIILDQKEAGDHIWVNNMRYRGGKKKLSQWEHRIRLADGREVLVVQSAVPTMGAYPGEDGWTCFRLGYRESEVEFDDIRPCGYNPYLYQFAPGAIWTIYRGVSEEGVAYWRGVTATPDDAEIPQGSAITHVERIK